MIKNIFSFLILLLSFSLPVHAEKSIEWNETIETLHQVTTSHPASPTKLILPLSTLSPELQKHIRGVVANYDIYLIERLSKEEKWKTVSHLFSPLYQTINPQEITKIYGEYEAGDLKTRRPLLTIFGWASLPAIEKHALTNPLKHQALIKSLAHNPHLLKDLEILLKKVKKYENAILSLWREEPLEITKVVNSLYSRKGSNTFYRNYSPAWQYLFSYLRLAPLTKEETTGIVLAALFHSVTGIYFIPPADMKHFNHCRALLDYLHKRSQGIARVVDVLTTELKALPYTPELQFLPQVNVLKTLKRHRTTKAGSLQQLIPLLQTNTFKDSASSFAHHAGRIRVAHFLLTNLKHDLIPLLMALGELEVYVCLAKTYQDGNQSLVKLSITPQA